MEHYPIQEKSQGPRDPITHELKCHPGPFQALRCGIKTFEWRKDDRDYQEGDTLWIREWFPDPSMLFYSGDELRFTVTYIIREGFGIPPGYCIMALAAQQASVDRIKELEIDNGLLIIARDQKKEQLGHCEKALAERDGRIKELEEAGNAMRAALKVGICPVPCEGCAERQTLIAAWDRALNPTKGS